MIRDLRDLARRTEVLANDLTVTVPLRMVEAAAAAVEHSVNDEIAHDAPHRLVAGGPVGTKHMTLRRSANPSVLVKATGPLHLLANPTDAHEIRAKRAQALRTPFGPRYSVQHPGTKGKNTWNRGVDKARPQITAVTTSAGVDAFRRAFR